MKTKINRIRIKKKKKITIKNEVVKTLLSILFPATVALWCLILFVIFLYFTTDTIHTFNYNSYTYKVLQSDDDIVNIVSTTCDTHNKIRDKIKCVANFYNTTEFIYHEDGKIKPPTEYYYTGGVCRDYAVAVCATLLEMNIGCDFGFSPDHVFPIAKRGKIYCICDRECVCND